MMLVSCVTSYVFISCTAFLHSFSTDNCVLWQWKEFLWVYAFSISSSSFHCGVTSRQNTWHLNHYIFCRIERAVVASLMNKHDSHVHLRNKRLDCKLPRKYNLVSWSSTLVLPYNPQSSNAHYSALYLKHKVRTI